MAASHFIRLKSVINKTGGVLAASRHNKRTLQAERGADAHIDATKTPLNYCLAGDSTPEAIATHAKVQMVKAGIDTPRKNGVMAVEVVFSLPIDRHQQDTKPFFSDCYQWTLKIFAGELLSFDVHLDESAPHAHALILPLIDGKMQGDNLKGNRTNIKRLRGSFFSEVGAKHGLSRADNKRLSAKDKQTIERQVLTRLQSDSVLKSSIWPCVRDAIHKDPMLYAEHLGITPPAKIKQNKSFVDIKRSKGKGNFIR